MKFHPWMNESNEQRKESCVSAERVWEASSIPKAYLSSYHFLPFQGSYSSAMPAAKFRNKVPSGSVLSAASCPVCRLPFAQSSNVDPFLFTFLHLIPKALLRQVETTSSHNNFNRSTLWLSRTT